MTKQMNDAYIEHQQHHHHLNPHVEGDFELEICIHVIAKRVCLHFAMLSSIQISATCLMFSSHLKSLSLY